MEFRYFEENVIPNNVCRELIRYYEANKKERIENEGKPNFTQVTLTQQNSILILEYLGEIINKYRNKFPYLPETNNMELIRIKKYEPNSNDQFDWHCDSVNLESSSRYLAILVYLNGELDSGETEFEDIYYEPSEGAVLIFPPFWTHPHRGLPVKGNSPKYIMSTYFRY